MSLTIQVADVELQRVNPTPLSTASLLERKYNPSTLLLSTNPQNMIHSSLSHGLAGSCLTAYNQHYHLELTPDQIWIAIMIAVAGYIDRHAEEMRSIFVAHEGQRELEAFGGGNIFSADYENLLAQLSDKIDENTLDDIRDWAECSFSTTTSSEKTVSKIVLMGAMKNYFSYKMSLMCGLPSITLKGVKEDWLEIRERVQRLNTWNQDELNSWAPVLTHVIDKFIEAYDGVRDVEFWNSIAAKKGGGSGPRYLAGWINALMPWDDRGDYYLNSLEAVLGGQGYGKVDTNYVGNGLIEVPVLINDNGREYKTLFVAGFFGTKIKSSKTDEDLQDMITPSVDWAIYDNTNETAIVGRPSSPF